LLQPPVYNMEEFLNPAEILKQLKLKEDMVAADFGCGSGGWVFPLARELEEGKVYAIDILEEPLSALKSRANTEKIFNIEIVQSDVERERGSRLKDSVCDVVLLTNLLFECDDKKTVLTEAKRVLRPGGKMLVVDWRKDNPLTAEVEFVSVDEIKRLGEEVGLKLEKEFEAGSYNWGLIFSK
jgi:ubiquinone/menaquinone biosynthesis C-methylase UbiE